MNQTCPWHFLQQNNASISCEPLTCSWITQPYNTYSNIFFFLLAIALVYKFKETSVHKKASVFAFLIFAIGAISTFAHASMSKLAGLIDFIAIAQILYYFIYSHVNLDVLKSNFLYKTIAYVIFFSITVLISIYSILGVQLLIAALAAVLIYIEANSSSRKWSAQLKKIFIFLFVSTSVLVLELVFKVCTKIPLHSFWHIFIAFTFYYYSIHSLTTQIDEKK